MRKFWIIVGVIGTVSLAVAQDESDSPEIVQAIVRRYPFGVPPPPPPPPPTNNVIDEVQILEHEKIENTVKIVALTRFGGTPAVGFTDSASGKSYYLLAGQMADEFTVVDIDMVAGTVTLQKGTQEQTLPLRNPMNPTNLTLVAAGSLPLSAVSPVTAPAPSSTRQTYAQRQQERVDRARQQAEEQRRQREESQQKDLEQQVAERAEAAVQSNMRAVYLDMIRKGQEPPVPITLTPEEHQMLVNEGVLDP